MTRVLTFTDPHGELKSARAIVGLVRKEEPDLICCPGDFSYFGQNYEGFLKVLETLGREVLFVPGNHESEEDVKRVAGQFPFMREVTYQTIERAGALVIGLPATLEYWPGSEDDFDAVELCRTLWIGLDRKKPIILMVHYPPRGTRVAGMSHLTPDSGGSQVVRRVVEMLRPNLVLCGHYHQDFGKEDVLSGIRIVNPGPNGVILQV